MKVKQMIVKDFDNNFRVIKTRRTPVSILKWKRNKERIERMRTKRARIRVWLVKDLESYFEEAEA